MAGANGEFVKVYILLLRLIDEADLSVSMLADRLNLCEKDVLRALSYWEKAGLVRLSYDGNQITQMELLEVGAGTGPVTVRETGPDRVSVVFVPAKVPEKSAGALAAVAEDEDFKDLARLAEKYLGRTLGNKDLELLAWMVDGLRFPTDLVAYLVEYCVDGGHRAGSYLEAVARGWHEEGIDTLEKAKQAVREKSAGRRSVLKAFGISGRGLGTAEERRLQRWMGELGMPAELVELACSATIEAIHKPSFDYAEKILEGWAAGNIRTLPEAEEALRRRREESSRQYREKQLERGARKNAFANFEQRDTSYEALFAGDIVNADH